MVLVDPYPGGVGRVFLRVSFFHGKGEQVMKRWICQHGRMMEWEGKPNGMGFYRVEEVESILSRYDELIFAVATKNEGETRHQTALRYIREEEIRAISGEAGEGGIDSPRQHEIRTALMNSQEVPQGTVMHDVQTCSCAICTATRKSAPSSVKRYGIALNGTAFMGMMLDHGDHIGPEFYEGNSFIVRWIPIVEVTEEKEE
jgi:hypothetical protein